MEKMTRKEMFAAIKAMAEKANANDIVEFCDKEIDTLAKRSAKAKEKAAEKANIIDDLERLVAECLTKDLAPISEIAAKVVAKDPEATVAKVAYRLNDLVKRDAAWKEKITIPATETSKARTVQGYAFVPHQA